MISVSGTLLPDATGDYPDFGFFGGKRAYQIAGGAYTLWFDTSIGAYTLSEVIGVIGSLGWVADQVPVEGTYTFYGTATGIATVTLP